MLLWLYNFFDSSLIYKIDGLFDERSNERESFSFFYLASSMKFIIFIILFKMIFSSWNSKTTKLQKIMIFVKWMCIKNFPIDSNIRKPQNKKVFKWITYRELIDDSFYFVITFTNRIFVRHSFVSPISFFFSFYWVKIEIKSWNNKSTLNGN